MSSRLRGVLSILGFIAAWELVARSGVAPAAYFPPPSLVAATAVAEFRRGDLPAAVVMTFLRATIGLAAATAVGLGAALLTARYEPLRRAFDPIAEFLRPLPPAAIVPLSIFFFGLGWQLYGFILLVACFWPVYLNASQALASVPQVQLQTGRTFGYEGWPLMAAVRLPAALPTVFIGIRQAAGIALIATIVTEMLAGRNGLGFYLMDSGMTLQIPQTFAGLVAAMLSGIVINWVVVRLRTASIGWHEAMTAQTVER